MGENITFSGLFEAELRIGDIVEVGPDLVLQVSAPRNPCSRWAWRLGQPASILRKLVESGVVGFYLRVLTPGHARAGDAVRVRSPHPRNLSVAELARLMRDAKAAPESVRSALEMAAGRPAAKRAEVARSRFHVAARKGVALAAGGVPSEAEASRMVAEFLARGGRITACAPAEDAPPGGEGDRGETG